MAGQGSCETDSVLVCDWSNVPMNLLAEDGSPLFADAQISCGGQTFDVQRILLAAFSPFLKQLFITHQEKSPGKPLVLQGEFVTKESFALILELICKGQITIDGDNVLRLHSAGNYLEIDQVTNRCADFIVKGLNVDCVVSVWDYACKVTASANRLLKEAVRFMDENFSELVKHYTVLALKKGEFCLLLSQLRNVDDENLVLEVVLEWLGHDWNGRFKDCEEVLSRVLWQCVDYARCHDGMLARIKACVDGNSHDQMQAVTAITSKMFKVTEETLLHADVHYLFFNEESRFVFRKLSISAQEHKNKNTRRTRKITWQERDNFPTGSIGEPRQIQPVMGYVFAGVFAFQGRMLAVLCDEGDEKFSQGFMLAVVSENGDMKVIAQLEVLEVNNASGFVEITSHGGLFSILLSTSDNTCVLASYDIRKFGRRLAFDDSEVFAIPFFAQTLTGLAETSWYSTPFAFNTDVYFFGGSNENYEEGIYAKVLHLPGQTWSELPRLQNYRFRPSVAFIDRSFFVVGGGNGAESVSNAAEMLSMDAPTAWTQLPGLRNGRAYCSLISCGDFLLAFGGRDGNDEVVEKAEILDLQDLAKGWEEYPPLHGVYPEFVVKV